MFEKCYFQSDKFRSENAVNLKFFFNLIGPICSFCVAGLKRESNAWLKSTCKGPPGIAKAFLDVIELTTKHGGWDLVGKGKGTEFLN